MEHLYMFAIMPPDDVALSIDKERKAFALQYNLLKALKPPVHITLYEPFKWAGDIGDRLGAVRNLAAKQKAFDIHLRDFGFFIRFPRPVVFIHVERTEVLKLLQRALKQIVNDLRGERSLLSSFNPHFTICYREDISPELLDEIKTVYMQRRFSASFVCDAIYLWKHNGNQWEVHETFQFGKGSGAETEYGQQRLF